jgi:hypothetical protein
VIGAAAGAVVGGLVGLVTSLNEASADISKSKVNTALTSFADKVQAINNGLAGGTLANVESGAIQAARDQLKAARSEQTSINRDEATHTFSGFHFDEFNALQRKSDRQNFGQQLPAIATVLNRQADQLGRAKVGENAQKLAEQLANGGDGLNREFIAIVAGLRGVSISQVVGELRKNIEAGQRAAKTEEATRKGRQVQEQDVNAFGRFVSAIEAAADSLDQLRTRASLLNEVFDGTINASRVSLGGNRLDQLGRPDRGALLPLDALAAVGGEPGRRLRQAGGVADDLARALPGVLTDVLRNPPGEGKDQAVQIAEGLARSLGHQPGKVPDELQRGIAVIQAGASKFSGDKGPEGLLERARTDVTKLAEELLSGFADPIKEAGRKGADALQANVQEFLDGLATVARQMQAVGQLEDQLADIRQGNFRTNLQFAATAAGRPGQAFDNATVAQLEANLTAKQQRLAPGLANPFDPDALARTLADTRQRLTEAEGRVQVEGRKDVRSDAFKDAANEAIRLKVASNNLVLAMTNVAKVAERTAVLQEKLNRIQQEREGRLGLQERYATADFAQRAQLNYGLLLANRANNLGVANGGDFKGVLDKFGVEEVRAIIDFLRGAGGTTFKGFQGAPRADDLLRNLLQGFGGLGLDAQQLKEEAEARKEFQRRQEDAEKAQQDLITAQKNLPNELKTTLTTLQQNFFTRLEAFLAQTQLSDVQNKQTTGAIGLGEAQERQRQADSLTKLGFASGPQVKENFEAVNKYLDQTAIILAGKKAAAGAGERVDKTFAESAFAGGQIADFSQGKAGPAYLPEQARFERDQRLKEYVAAKFPELDDDAQNRVVGGFRSEFAARQKLTPENISLARDNPAEYARQAAEALKRALATEFAGGGPDTRFGKAVAGQTDAFKALSGVKNLDFDKLNAAADDPKKLEALKKALDAFKDGASFEDASKKIKQLVDELARLKDQAAVLRQTIEQGNKASQTANRPTGEGFVEFQADGGSIFRPRGTDTVPAMLTPGEYVVNAASSQANLSLLERINRARGPVYKAGGGVLGWLRRATETSADTVKKATLGAADLVTGGEVSRQQELDRRIQDQQEREVKYRADGGIIPPEYADQVEDNVRLARALARGRGQDFTAEDEARITRETVDRQKAKEERENTIQTIAGQDTARAAEAIKFARAKANAEGRSFTFEDEQKVATRVADDRFVRRENERFERAVGGPDADRARDAVQFARAKANAAGAPLNDEQARKVFVGAVDRAQKQASDKSAFENKFGFVSPDVEQALRFSRALAKAQGRELTAADEEDVANRAIGPALRRKDRASEAAIARAGAEQVRAGKFGPASVLGGALGTVGLSLPLVNGKQEGAAPAGQKKAATTKELRALQEARYRAAVREFNRRGAFGNSAPRPGAEGQRNIGAADAERNLKEQEDAFRRAIDFFKNVNGYASGGSVGGFGFSSVDSVPALLAPGEFVLNARAASRLGASNLRHFNEGGPVAGGGAEASQSASSLANAIAQFGQSSQLLTQAFTSFNGSANSLAEALNNMPKTLSGQFTHSVNVNVNGAEVLAKLQPEIERMVTEQTKEVLSRSFKEQMPDAGVSVF